MKHFVKLFLILIVFGFKASVLADHVDPIASTNKNEQTNLFKESVEDVKGFENQINGGKDSALNRLSGSSQVLEDITGKRGSEVKQETNKLENIRANDLESAGAKEMQEKNVIEELYINEENTLWQGHKNDAAKIANASSDLLSNLMDKLKEIGVDCKQVKGSKVIEPEYYINMKTEASKDAKYDLHYCEDLRNKYSCRNILTLKCIRKGKRYGVWKYREVQVPGNTVYNQAKHLGHAVFWKKKRYGWHLRLDSAGWRGFLSGHLNIPIMQIGEQISFPNGGRGVGDGTHPIYEDWRVVFDVYAFGYQYRDAQDVCEKWDEDWAEECKL